MPYGCVRDAAIIFFSVATEWLPFKARHAASAKCGHHFLTSAFDHEHWSDTLHRLTVYNKVSEAKNGEQRAASHHEVAKQVKRRRQANGSTGMV